jgi:ABC-type branched-subunit amino acid transport system ATPase component
MAAFREQARQDAELNRREFDLVVKYLSVADRVTTALEQLSQQLFRELLGVIEEKLTLALQEVLEQPISLKAKAEWKRNAASVNFWIERDGQAEDILRGQGGSVANILSVGLRMFALVTLDERAHRPFLVLDEQDCWLRPDLVPRLVRIVRDAGTALGFQVLMISHHDVEAFRAFADRIYLLAPSPEGVVATIVHDDASEPDPA